jgi:hypothetical protein
MLCKLRVRDTDQILTPNKLSINPEVGGNFGVRAALRSLAALRSIEASAEPRFGGGYVSLRSTGDREETTSSSCFRQHHTFSSNIRSKYAGAR